jgi:hypothetical protein
MGSSVFRQTRASCLPILKLVGPRHLALFTYCILFIKFTSDVSISREIGFVLGCASEVWCLELELKTEIASTDQRIADWEASEQRRVAGGEDISARRGGLN